MKKRKGYYPPGMYFLASKELEEISSTEIRMRLQKGGNLEELMHAGAAEYLRKNVTYPSLKSKDKKT